MRTVRFIGPGRAGRSLAAALTAGGWETLELRGRGDRIADAALGVDALVLSVPDDRVADVARSVRPADGCVVVHLSGSLGLEVLAPHRRPASLHPLVPLPDPATGARRLAAGIAFAVAGDPLAAQMATSLGGIVLSVPADRRVAYHAAACIAANHLVALMGQVERVAAAAELPLAAFLPLARAALDDVAAAGPHRALTGPAARGDWATVERHLAALPQDERAAYRSGVDLVRALTATGGAAQDVLGESGAEHAVGAPRAPRAPRTPRTKVA